MFLTFYTSKFVLLNIFHSIICYAFITSHKFFYSFLNKVNYHKSGNIDLIDLYFYYLIYIIGFLCTTICCVIIFKYEFQESLVFKYNNTIYVDNVLLNNDLVFPITVSKHLACSQSETNSVTFSLHILQYQISVRAPLNARTHTH